MYRKSIPPFNVQIVWPSCYANFTKFAALFPLLSGTRIGQASECFVYWKDTATNDTWGLNFTSPIDAKQFRECCVSSSDHRKILSLLSFDSFHLILCLDAAHFQEQIERGKKEFHLWYGCGLMSRTSFSPNAF